MNYAIITVDTEGHDGLFPIEKLIFGQTKKGDFGIGRIMDICDEFNVKALFFVDIAECWEYGEDKIRPVIYSIQERGHYIGVHIHPDHMADKKRLFLWEYSEKEQREIITLATHMYKKITGESPIYFRAGKYSANAITLSILKELGYKYDFSQFYGQKWCHINPPVAINYPHALGTLTEIPVTTFSVGKLFSYEKFEKVDLEMDTRQFRYAINQLNKEDGVIISLFLHSFSLLNWRKNPDNPTPCYCNIKKMRKQLELVSKKSNITFCNASELDAIVPSVLCDVKEKKPLIQIRNPLRSYYMIMLTAFRIASFNKTARLLICASCVAFFLLLIAALLLNI